MKETACLISCCSTIKFFNLDLGLLQHITVKKMTSPADNHLLCTAKEKVLLQYFLGYIKIDSCCSLLKRFFFVVLQKMFLFQDAHKTSKYKRQNTLQTVPGFAVL
jgi:hypothetical protein